MKKIILALLLLLIILCLFVVQVTQQRQFKIKAPFLTIYSSLVYAQQWERWRADLREAAAGDSAKIKTEKDKDGFTLTLAGKTLHLNYRANSFFIDDQLGNRSVKYDYALLPSKLNDSTVVIVNRTINVAGYLSQITGADIFADTHIADLKNFMETDSLRYGYPIRKIKVPSSNMLEIKRDVPVKEEFNALKDMEQSLRFYMKKNNATQTLPMIAQYLPAGKDSVHLNIGIYIDKKVSSEKNIAFVMMPKGAPLYTVRYKGAFGKRDKVYDSLRSYFADYGYQLGILPFETYLDNKLPTSDTDTVNIEVSFSSYR